MIKGAIALAENAPIQLHAARQAELRIRTRYETGLSTIAEVAEAERLLTIAQVQAAIARIGVWQALLAASNTRGDIQPFLQQVASARAQERTGM
jgi:outer membrane protein TolC